MRVSNVCMCCHGEPEPFETDSTEVAYYMVKQPKDDDFSTLTSNLEYVFTVYLDRNYTAKDGETFVCIDCFEKIVDREEEEGT